ncbi:unnamed protein product [Rotaria sp. Silwood2]|nr:unnamed protein product [Rotaria sp. Silwood2]CAF2959844.1 unnamed protein product [Rotaria sp. Silwood2]CAF3259946.1 unnamed protein product [Rotaria sp. Silwood2]CAF3339522.1 unnamed protein product [Rotaria sp. Silwood2]CAF4066795.1 unnamed protein product [Rotaria sp. Silwood2]
MVCDVVNLAGPNPDLRPVLSVALSTHHEVYESGACVLRTPAYAVVNPVALEDIATLQQLKFRSDLCSHVFNVDRGYGP